MYKETVTTDIEIAVAKLINLHGPDVVLAAFGVACNAKYRDLLDASLEKSRERFYSSETSETRRRDERHDGDTRSAWLCIADVEYSVNSFRERIRRAGQSDVEREAEDKALEVAKLEQQLARLRGK